MDCSASLFAMPADSAASSLADQLVAWVREGRVDEAVGAAREALTEARHEAEEAGVAESGLVGALEALGMVEKELGHGEDAEGALREALELAVASAATKETLARLRTNLATLLDFSQREADAVPLYEQAIADYEGMSPPAREVSAQLRNNLAMIYKGIGKFALAEQHYLRALELLDSEPGARTEAVAAVFNNLGGLYYTAGFAEQAKEMFTEGLTARVALLGPDHPDVAQSHCNLGTVCHELGDNEAAIEHFERGLAILEEHIQDEAASFEAVGQDYLSLLELMGDEKRAGVLRKRLQRVLA